MRIVVLVVVIGWAAWGIFWFASATKIKAGRSNWSALLVLRAVVAVIVLVVVLLTRGHHMTVPLSGPWLIGVRLALWVAGLAVAVWARAYLGRNWGMPMTRKDQPDLVETGPYRFIRHPIYAGVILGLAGTALATSVVGLIVVAVVAGYFTYSAFREERYLTGLFPDAYPAYKHATKMLVPFVF
jgi:protein-S-isoprenylcysteine O-methyltransferase Ste14